MKIAHINENNQLLGWYDKEIHALIPTPNIEVSDVVWQEALEKGHNKVNQDGSTELFDFRTQEEIQEQNVQMLKQAKEIAKQNIVVTTTSGKSFDGNESARNNMLSAIQTATFLNQESSYWKLADNTVVDVTIEELQEALALSIQKCGQIVMASTIEELNEI